MDWKVMHLQAIRACVYQTFSSIMKLKTHAKITENIKNDPTAKQRTKFSIHSISTSLYDIILINAFIVQRSSIQPEGHVSRLLCATSAHFTSF